MFKVGDKVWCDKYGLGLVIAVHKEKRKTSDAVLVRFGDYITGFTLKGQYLTRKQSPGWDIVPATKLQLLLNGGCHV